METNDAQRQLDEATHLASITQAEATHSARWAWPVMAAAMVAFFAVFGLLDQPWQSIASAAWSLFVVAWVYAIRRGNRALPRPRQRTRDERRHDYLEWGALLVVFFAVTALLSHVSWALVGVALAALGTGYGALSARRAHA